jgi:hypothetical protein
MSTQRQIVVVDGIPLTRNQVEQAKRALGLPEFKLGDYVEWGERELSARGFVIDCPSSNVPVGNVAQFCRDRYLSPGQTMLRFINETTGSSTTAPVENVRLLVRPSYFYLQQTTRTGQ